MQAAHGATAATAGQVAEARLPSCQDVMARSASLLEANISRPSAAEVTAFTAMPVSSSVTTSVRPPDRDTA